MATITALKSGLKARLETISGLIAFDYVPGHLTPPSAVPFVDEIEYDTANARGLDTYQFTVRLYVATLDNVDEESQDALHAYLASSGSGSVKAAIEGDGTLDGAATDALVTRALGDLMLEHANTAYLGAEFTVQVWATGA